MQCLIHPFFEHFFCELIDYDKQKDECHPVCHQCYDCCPVHDYEMQANLLTGEEGEVEWEWQLHSAFKRVYAFCRFCLCRVLLRTRKRGQSNLVPLKLPAFVFFRDYVAITSICLKAQISLFIGCRADFFIFQLFNIFSPD